MVYRLTSSTMIDSAILKVNSISSSNGGSGSTIIARIRTMSIGAASVLTLAPLKRVAKPQGAVHA